MQWIAFAMDSFGNGIDSPWNKNALGLRGSFSAALIVHLVLLLGLSFGAAKSPSPSLMMEVTLAYTPSEDAPDNAAFIAQVNQLGDEEDIVKENPALSVQVEEYNEAPQDSRQWLAGQEPRESVAALQAKLNRLQESYQSLPKISRMTSASTKSAPEAAYMRQFELRVEHVGIPQGSAGKEAHWQGTAIGGHYSQWPRKAGEHLKQFWVCGFRPSCSALY